MAIGKQGGENPRNPRAFNTMARLGGFDLKNAAELNAMNEAESNQYNEDRLAARNRGISELLYMFSDAFKGRDIQGRAQARRNNRMLMQQNQDRIARQQQLKEFITNANIPDSQKAFLGTLPSDLQAELASKVIFPDATKSTTDQQNYSLAVQQGYNGTFMDYMKDKKSPLVNIVDKNESEFQKQASASGFKIINEATKQVNDFADIEGRLGILQKQLQGGNLETGVFEEMKIPFKRLAAGLNILPQEELDSLDAQELFQRTVNFIVPRLRVSGSGSTSDTEVQLFRESAPALSLTQGGNLLIVGGMSSIAKHNRKRLNLMNKYIEDKKLGNGDLIGFGEYADQVLGPVFKSYNSNESFDKQVKEGKLKAGDFVFDGIYGDFRILTEDDVKGIR